VEGGKERAGFHLKRSVGELLYAARYAETMLPRQRDGLQDEKIERAGQKLSGYQVASYRLSICYASFL
jgi:hypothetical protein